MFNRGLISIDTSFQSKIDYHLVLFVPHYFQMYIYTCNTTITTNSTGPAIALLFVFLGYLDTKQAHNNR